MSGQLEFLDINRGTRRPPGGGQVTDGFFVYHSEAQRVDQVSYTLGCTTEHVYHLIDAGELDAADISADTSSRACYRIPRQAVLDYIKAAKAKAINR